MCGWLWTWTRDNDTLLLSMAGIYIHIPYCKQACSYCDFYFSTNTKSQGAFVEALLREIEMRKAFFGVEPKGIETLYFGGGTPSLLTPDELRAILQALHQNYTIHPDAEVTLEANPDDLTEAKLHMLRAAGINRLSVGIQSFYEADLQMMHRAHDAQMASGCVGLAQRVGFDNISIDLMFHLPGQTLTLWQENLNIALALGVPHISVYGLTVEPKTLLAHQLATGKLTASDEDAFTEEFDLLMEMMAKHGYEQYEISNFSKPGWRSRHNSSYWAGLPYLGLGPSAHSYDGARTRTHNSANLHTYIEMLQGDKLAATETELLTDAQQFNEFLLTRLRLIEGVSLAALKQLNPALFETWIKESSAILKHYQDDGLLASAADRLQLTQPGRHLADAITAAFILPV